MNVQALTESKNQPFTLVIIRGVAKEALHYTDRMCSESAREHYASEINDRKLPEEKSSNCPHQSKIKGLINKLWDLDSLDAYVQFVLMPPCWVWLW